eukprot:902983-Alexandrium_andersonii.AAC.1
MKTCCTRRRRSRTRSRAPSWRTRRVVAAAPNRATEVPGQTDEEEDRSQGQVGHEATLVSKGGLT